MVTNTNRFCLAASLMAATTFATAQKQAVEVEDVPPAVLKAVKADHPMVEIHAAEHETRHGEDYFDIEATLPDGTEIEFDLTRLDNVWTVVEVQRDLDWSEVATPAWDLLRASYPEWKVSRIIESVQRDESIIYEFFGPGDDGSQRKIEVMWADSSAEILEEEWVH